MYPLSPKRKVPDHIQRPDYAEDGRNLYNASVRLIQLNWCTGKPASELRSAGQPPRILSLEEQEKMRTVCRVRFLTDYESMTAKHTSIACKGGTGYCGFSRATRNND